MRRGRRGPAVPIALLALFFARVSAVWRRSSAILHSVDMREPRPETHETTLAGALEQTAVADRLLALDRDKVLSWNSDRAMCRRVPAVCSSASWNAGSPAAPEIACRDKAFLCKGHVVADHDHEERLRQHAEIQRSLRAESRRDRMRKAQQR